MRKTCHADVGSYAYMFGELGQNFLTYMFGEFGQTFLTKLQKKPNTMILNLVNTSIIFDSVRHILLTIIQIQPN